MKNKKLLGILGITALLLAGNFAFKEVKEVDAANVNANTYVYFEIPDNWNATRGVCFMIGHSTWSQGYNMTKIANTNYYYVKMPKWDGYSDYAFFNENNWGGEDNKIANRKAYAANSTNVLQAGEGVGKYTIERNYNLFGNHNLNPIGNYGENVSDLNCLVDTIASEGGTSLVSGYKLNTATASALNEGASASVLKYTDATLVATPNTGYEFVGWYDAETGGELLSSSERYVVSNIDDNKTYYARFENVALKSVTSLVNKYYNSGEYVRNTTINIDQQKVGADLLANIATYGDTEYASLFHASSTSLERTTYFTKDALWMSRGKEGEGVKYSYYGSEGGNLTSGTATNPKTVPTYYTAIANSSMEKHYITLTDIKNHLSSAIWSESNGVYTSTDRTLITDFLAFTAPCFLNTDKKQIQNYFTLASVSIEENDSNNALILKLVTSGEEGKLVDGAQNVLSQAVITIE